VLGVVEEADSNLQVLSAGLEEAVEVMVVILREGHNQEALAIHPVRLHPKAILAGHLITLTLLLQLEAVEEQEVPGQMPCLQLLVMEELQNPHQLLEQQYIILEAAVDLLLHQLH
jgi:hypothetical protein